MKADLYSEFTLPHAVVEAVRVEERRLETRLAVMGLLYEIAEAVLEFQPALVPMLAVSSASKDRGDEEWLTASVLTLVVPITLTSPFLTSQHDAARVRPREHRSGSGSRFSVVELTA